MCQRSSLPLKAGHKQHFWLQRKGISLNETRELGLVFLTGEVQWMFQRSLGSPQLCIRSLMNVNCVLEPRHTSRLFSMAAHRHIALICLHQLCSWHEALLVQLPLVNTLRPGLSSSSFVSFPELPCSSFVLGVLRTAAALGSSAGSTIPAADSRALQHQSTVTPHPALV